MKKICTFYLLFSFIYMCLASICFADTKYDKDNVLITAQKTEKINLEGEINKRIMKKFTPVKLTITNKSNSDILLSNKIYYIDKNNEEHKIPTTNLIYKKTRRHTTRRAIIWGISATVLTFGFFAIPAIAGSIAYCATTNGTLEDNIRKNNFKPNHVFNNDSYSAYVFIPNKYKKVKNIIIKEVSFDNDKTFYLSAPVIENN